MPCHELLRSALSASKNANYQTLTNDSTTIIPFFHTKKHNAPFTETTQRENSTRNSRIFLYTINKFKLNKLTCLSCQTCLLSQFTSKVPDHDYCAINYCDVTSASTLTLFINNGCLTIPSRSVYLVVEYAEKISSARLARMATRFLAKQG